MQFYEPSGHSVYHRHIASLPLLHNSGGNWGNVLSRGRKKADSQADGNEIFYRTNFLVNKNWARCTPSKRRVYDKKRGLNGAPNCVTAVVHSFVAPRKYFSRFEIHRRHNTVQSFASPERYGIHVSRRWRKEAIHRGPAYHAIQILLGIGVPRASSTHSSMKEGNSRGTHALFLENIRDARSISRQNHRRERESSFAVDVFPTRRNRRGNRYTRGRTHF